MATVPFPEVKDRNVATPSRVRLTKPVDIEDDEVFDVEAEPGTVYEEGTPLNKEFFDALKRYIDASSGAGEIVGIEYGGTGADNAADARTNLEVYSKAEVDEELDRTAGLIEPHITRRVTDSTDGVHGFYIDQDYTMWIDPDGDGVYEEMPSSIQGSNANGELDDLGVRVFEFTNAGAGWNTFIYPEGTMLEDAFSAFVICDSVDYTVKIKDVGNDSLLYELIKYDGSTTSEGIQIRCVLFSYWGE